MTLDASGNLGIGTTSPSQKLTVNGNIETQNAGYVRSVGTGSDSAGVGPNIGVNTSGVYYIQQLNASNGLDFWYYNAGWNKRMTLDSSGNLGLGVTPSAWLSSTLAMQLGNYGSVYAFKNSGNVYLNNNLYVDSGGSDVYLNTAPAGRYRITDNEIGRAHV